MEFEKIDHFDEKIGGFVFVTDGDQDFLDDPPPSPLTFKRGSLSSIPSLNSDTSSLDDGEKSRKKGLSSFLTKIRKPFICFPHRL